MVHQLAERLWILGVLVRVVAVCALLLGPWTNDPDELSGWDVERFQAITERDGPGWSEFPIEYPPGSVVIFDAIAGSTVVETGRAIVVLAAVAEVLTVLLLWRWVNERSAKVYLLLGLPLVPMGFVRLDLLAVTLALSAAIVLVGRQGSTWQNGQHQAATGRPNEAKTANTVGLRLPELGVIATAGFGVLVTAGAMVKIWPALVVAGAVAIRRLSAATTAVLVTGLTGLIWLIAVGDGLTPVDQVLSLRGATGWHIESLPGAFTALLGSEDSRLELNAFRIGTLNETVVGLGRAVAIVVIAALTVIGFSASEKPSSGQATPAATAGATGSMTPLERVGYVMLGSVAALVVTAPLLSPQFLLWLTPWGALLLTNREPLNDESRQLLTVLLVVVTLTGGTLLLFGPPNLAGTLPAALLTIRNVGLLVIPVLCLRSLLRAAQPTGADR